MTAKERILAMLRHINDPTCDDCLTHEASLQRRQIANATCRELSGEGLIRRQHGFCSLCRKEKIVNWRLIDPILDDQPKWIREGASKLWYSQENIQVTLAAWLFDQGHAIRHVSTPTIHELGKNIVAVRPDGRELWVSVKGYADNQRFIQARYLFSGAVLDLVLDHDEQSRAHLALGLPDTFAVYMELARRIFWLRTIMPLCIYWVSESGNVRVE